MNMGIPILIDMITVFPIYSGKNIVMIIMKGRIDFNLEKVLINFNLNMRFNMIEIINKVIVKYISLIEIIGITKMNGIKNLTNGCKPDIRFFSSKFLKGKKFFMILYDFLL